MSDFENIIDEQMSSKSTQKYPIVIKSDKKDKA